MTNQKAIQNNNGWKKIEREADLPNNDMEFWVIDKGQLCKKSFNHHLPNNVRYWFENITHYQPIIKPQPPIY